jgi:hypothetical protein
MVSLHGMNRVLKHQVLYMKHLAFTYINQQKLGLLKLGFDAVGEIESRPNWSKSLADLA